MFKIFPLFFCFKFSREAASPKTAVLQINDIFPRTLTQTTHLSTTRLEIILIHTLTKEALFPASRYSLRGTSGIFHHCYAVSARVTLPIVENLRKMNTYDVITSIFLTFIIVFLWSENVLKTDLKQYSHKIKSVGYINIFPTCDPNTQTIDNRSLNVLILYPDDWRHDSIGSENPIIQTPFLDSLADKGIRFRQNAVSTSICWISRATLFTGQYSSGHKSEKLRCSFFTREEKWNSTWPAYLQKFGNYFVGHVGKWQYHSDNTGRFDWSRFHEGAHWYNVNGKRVTAASRARDDAIDFLRERPKDKPFALTVAFYPPKPVSMAGEPGAQWTPDKENRDIYENVTIKEPFNYSKAHMTLPNFLRPVQTTARFRYRVRYGTRVHYQESMKNYYALVTQVDKESERIVEELKRQGIENDTMIIFTTDNGMFHGAHGLSGKWYPYQESIRVPLIVYDPRMPESKRGSLNDDFTLNVDLAKTILGAGQVTPPVDMNGRDISDLYLNGECNHGPRNGPWRDEFFYEFPPIQGGIPASTALVNHKWKYINWPQHNYEQLFDLENDPLEMNDLRGNPKLETVMNELRKDHNKLRDEIQKPNETSLYVCN